jgi:hypothetical protein
LQERGDHCVKQRAGNFLSGRRTSARLFESSKVPTKKSAGNTSLLRFSKSIKSADDGTPLDTGKWEGSVLIGAE